MFGLFGKKQEWPELEFDEIQKRARLLVIDDNDFIYESLFIRDGYTIEKWNDVDDLPKLERGFYDIILLDIQGVGGSQSEEQGFGILKHLRKTTPAQIIIAFSNSDWSLKYQDFFDLADARLAKQADYVEFKRVVDELLRKRFSLGFYSERIINSLNGSAGDTQKLKKIIEDAITSKDIDKLSTHLKSKTDDKDAIQIALGVAQVAIGIAQL